MLLDLREIIELPGAKTTFEFEPDMTKALGGSITGIKAPAKATGEVKNTAGMLTFTCKLEAVFKCTCARCLKEFDYPVETVIKTDITESGIGENPDGYYIQGNKIDATDIIVTEFILDTDERQLCSADCPGLCQKCGRDLNKGPCSCKKDTDPRLEVLKQLLD